jgi:hypothetical protein
MKGLYRARWCNDYISESEVIYGSFFLMTLCAGAVAVLQSRPPRCLVIIPRRSPRQARSCSMLLCLSRRDMGGWRKEGLLTNSLWKGVRCLISVRRLMRRLFFAGGLVFEMFGREGSWMEGWTGLVLWYFCCASCLRSSKGQTTVGTMTCDYPKRMQENAHVIFHLEPVQPSHVQSLMLVAGCPNRTWRSRFSTHKRIRDVRIAQYVNSKQSGIVRLQLHGKSAWSLATLAFLLLAAYAQRRRWRCTALLLPLDAPLPLPMATPPPLPKPVAKSTSCKSTSGTLPNSTPTYIVPYPGPARLRDNTLT